DDGPRSGLEIVEIQAVDRRGARGDGVGGRGRPGNARAGAEEQDQSGDRDRSGKPFHEEISFFTDRSTTRPRSRRELRYRRRSSGPPTGTDGQRRPLLLLVLARAGRTV